MKKETTVEEVYNEFWKGIVEVDGVVDMQAVKNELSDFSHMLDQVPKVYMEVTRGRISKPNTYASAVISEFNNTHWPKGTIQDDIRDILENADLTAEEKLSEIVDYLEL